MGATLQGIGFRDDALISAGFRVGAQIAYDNKGGALKGTLKVA